MTVKEEIDQILGFESYWQYSESPDAWYIRSPGETVDIMIVGNGVDKCGLTAICHPDAASIEDIMTLEVPGLYDRKNIDIAQAMCLVALIQCEVGHLEDLNASI